MENTMNLGKRVLSFIMALLMIFSTLIIFEMPTTEAAANLAFDQSNWKGWYECYLNDRSTMDSAGNLTVPTYTSVTGGYLHEAGFNPLEVSGSKIRSYIKQGNRGWDDFIAFSSNNYTYPPAYSMTVNIQTGMTMGGVVPESISDGGGYGAFSIVIGQQTGFATNAFDNFLWGVQFGLAGTKGYVITFTAEANSKNYYDSYVVFKTDENGNLSNPNYPSNLLQKSALTSKIAMANGTAPVTVELVRTGTDTYNIVLSNTNGLTQTLATGISIDDEEKVYYGAGAFSSGLHANANGKPITNSSFEIQSVGTCSGAKNPTEFSSSGHNYAWVETDNYKYQVCQHDVCDAIGNKRYEIYYDENGGSGAPADSYMNVDCNNNPEVNITFTVSSTTPTKSGYTFSGWLIQSNDSNVNGTVVQPGDKVKTKYHCTLVAQWVEGTYTLTLDAAGGTIASGYSNTYSFKTNQKLADKIGGFPTATKTGYTFNGWKLTSSGEHWVDGWGTQPFTWGQNVTFTAQWIANQYTVDFDVNGNTQITFDGEPITVTYGQTYGTLPTISRVGYTFNGWYTAASGGTRITASSTVSTASDHTLYAHWTAKSYTLTFALDGGTQASGYSTTYTFKQDQKFADVIGGFPAPIKRGYLFNGWKNLATGEHWTGGWGTQPYTYGANVTLTAQWVEDPDFKPYYLIFDVNGGNMTSNHATTYGIDTGDKYADIIGTIPTAERTGYTFGGWYSSKYNYTLEINGTFTAAEDVTLVAQWIPIQSVVTLDLNDANGTKATCSVSSITVSYDSTYSALPTPTRTGYTFNGWYTAASGGTKITTSTKVTITSAQTLYAHWTANSYTLTFVLQGGTMPSGYAESYTFLADQKFNDVIGGFPIPTRAGYNFRYWQWSNRTDHCWETEWGANQTYYFGQNITVYARWDAATYTVSFDKNALDATLSTTSKTVTYGQNYGTLPTPSRGEDYLFDGWFTAADGGTRVTADTVVTATSNHTLYAHWLDAASYTVTFNSNGYINVQDYRVPKQVRVSDTSLPGGGTTASFNIARDQTFASAVGNDSYFPTHNLWTFVGWLASYNDANGNPKVVILSADNWTTAVFDGTSDVTCTAYYMCQHSRFTNSIIAWDSTTDPDRVIGRCRVCGFDGAYAYTLAFLARYNNAADILLSYGVPQDELFTYENCLYDSTNGYIIDFLDITNTHPKITIKFNPVVIAALNSDAGWLGWEVEGDSTVNVAKNVEYIFDQNNDARNKHLRFRSAYEDGYYEVVFNAGSGLKGEYVDNGVLVDSNRRYGVIPIRNNEVMHDLIDYIPQAKHIGLYAYGAEEYFNPIPFESGGWYSYSNSSHTLYCSIGWTNAENFAGNSDTDKNQRLLNAWSADRTQGSTTCNILDSTTCERPVKINKDIQVLPWYFSRPRYGGSADVHDDGVAQGYLATFYANNKGAQADYSKAYFDLNERSGGTMYYKYYINSSGGVSCEPVFAYDRSDYDLKETFIFEPSNPTECSADFNINVYIQSRNIFASYSTVISQEPKRYTYYLGEGDHYVFPKVVADPAGVEYSAADLLHSDDKDIPDPGFDKITDENGDTYYNSLRSPQNQFKLSRTSQGYPVCNLYTQHATWEGFGFANGLPLGFPGLSYYFNGGTNALYTPVQPHGGGYGYFVTALGYQDYGNAYGAAIPLTYPDGNNFVSMYASIAAAGLPMQACYYTQWDFVTTFNANYPEGQEHDNSVGYPTSLPSGKTANVDSDGNHFVYDFFNSFSSTKSKSNRMFTCEDYVIDAWQLFDANGNPIRYDKNEDGVADSYLILDTFDKYPGLEHEYKQLSTERKNELEVSIYNAYVFAQVPGTEFRAIWKRIYDFTLIEDEAGKGAAEFAEVKYKDKFEEDQEAYLTETTTLRVYPDSKITVKDFAASSGYDFEYLTLNNQKYPTVPGRIVTNGNTYTFTILSDTTMTAQFVSSSSTTKLLLDRNNWPLNKWTWRLYNSYKAMRDSSSSFYASTLSPSYALYKNGTSTYTVTVNGSTFADANTTYTKYYDQVITLMTAATNTSSRRFVGWQVDGNFVSYDPIFDYRVTGDATVTAVYSGTPTQTIAISSIESNADSREAFEATYAAPEGYKLIEAGFLVSTTEQTFTIEDVGECVTSSNYEKIVSANQSANGSFKLLVSSGTRYVAAYAYYYDKNNKIVYCISDTIKQ